MYLDSIRRYPIKSMQGEHLPTVIITERGLQGDRVYALLEGDTGNVVSAKNPRKWGDLLNSRAELLTPRHASTVPLVQITLPNGKRITTTQPDGDALLSEWLGREVSLILAPPRGAQRETYWTSVAGQAYQDTVTTSSFPPDTFFDFAAVHLLTTATLRHLQALYPAGQFAPDRFRPNLLIDVPDQEGFVENEWVGRMVDIGDNVRLRVRVPTPRCVVTTLPQAGLANDVGILKTAATHNRLEISGYGTFACVGVYAEVLRGGAVSVGDTVRVAT